MVETESLRDQEVDVIPKTGRLEALVDSYFLLMEGQSVPQTLIYTSLTFSYLPISATINIYIVFKKPQIFINENLLLTLC